MTNAKKYNDMQEGAPKKVASIIKYNAVSCTMAHLISLRCFWKRQDILWEGLIILICIKSCFQDRKCKKRYTKCKKRLQYMDYGGRRRYTYDIPIWQMIKTIVKLCVEHWSCVRNRLKNEYIWGLWLTHSSSENEMPKFFSGFAE